MNANNKDVFWLDQPTMLYENYLYFIPTPNMTLNQKLNAITLFCLYTLILLVIFNKNLIWVGIPLSIIALLILIYLIRKFVKKTEHFNPIIETGTQNANPIVETGYYDSDNVLRFNRVTGEQTKKPDVTYSCRKPTPDNPLMNPPVSDFNTDAPEACNVDDKEINNEITKAFSTNLYSDVGDVFSKMNSQRLFYTVPNTAIPNNQGEFANWLYRAPVTCKEDQEQCLRYEDLRFKR